MRYVITDTSITRISETYGTIQNVGRDKIELSNSADFADVFVLYSLNQVSFNEPLYIRAFDNGAKSFNIPVNVVQFIVSDTSSGGGTTADDTTIEDFEKYIEEIFSGENSETIDDPDFNSYVESIFNGNISVTTDNDDFNSYIDNIFENSAAG